MITLTNSSAFVLLGRNKANSIFYIRPKSDYVREKENKSTIISTLDGFYPEAEIIEMIDKGIKFYTHINSEFTDVIVVNNHLKSVPNDTKTDNINELPVIAAAEVAS